MRAASQRGLSGMVLIVLLLFAMIGLLAAFGLSRSTMRNDDRESTVRRLNLALDALDQFVASAYRLPCPANPAVDDGLEVRNGAVCTYSDGTLPWASIGMRRDDSYDAWDRKLSYRVYTGAKGSLTQDKGATMVHCDLVEPSLGATTGTGASEGRCVENNDPYLRTTRASKYLEGKELTLKDEGRSPSSVANVAYVVVSHGPTGLGGIGTNGVRREMPTGDERSNVDATGPFTAKPFSQIDIAATTGQHFDDFLVYRTLPDLMKKTGLAARDWPDTSTSSIVFNQATISAAYGSSVASGQSVGTQLDLGSARVYGFTGGSESASDISFDTSSSVGGIGIAGGSTTRLSSATGEWLRIDFTEAGQKFGVTLNHFGYYNLVIFGFDFGRFTERVELRFYRVSGQASPVLLLTQTATGCRDDGGLASFTVDVGAVFDRVEIRPLSATPSTAGFAWLTEFLLSEVIACTAATSQCRTALWSGGNSC